MPRKIPGLEEKILSTAYTWFMGKGFDAVDMKTLAESIGTSVGNLYNYYPSKDKLFLACIDHWWRGWKENLGTILAQGETPLEKLELFLLELMNLMERKRGLWKDLTAMGQTKNLSENSQILRMKYRDESRRFFSDQVGALLKNLGSLNPRLEALRQKDPQRMSMFILTPILHLPIFFPDAKQSNQDFIKDVVQALFGLREPNLGGDH